MNDLKDSWDDMADDLFGEGAAVAAPASDMAVIAKPRVVSAKPAQEFKVNCGRCGGSGIYSTYHGQCYACRGVGYKVVKTDPAKLAQNRAKARERKVAAEEAKAAALRAKRYAWEQEHSEAALWIGRKAESFDFARNMDEALSKWGSLTDGQLAAVLRCVERDAARDKERAEAVAKAPVAVGVSKIEEAFAKAKSHIKWPKLRLAKFLFKPAGEYSKNAGAIYVMDAERKDDEGKAVYLGKVMGGRLQLMRNAQEYEAQVLGVIADPKAAAQAYGLEFGNCSICGRELTNKASIEMGIGPICAERFGW